MLFSYALVKIDDHYASELCIIPRKPSPENPPVPVRHLHATDCAVYYIGGDELTGHEALAIRNIPGGSGIEIRPVRPAVLYISPHNNERPGERTEALRLTVEANNEITVQFRRGTTDEWSNWQPNQRFMSNV